MLGSLPIECCWANSELFHRQGAKDTKILLIFLCALGVLAVKLEPKADKETPR